MNYPLGEPTNRPKPAPAGQEWTELRPGVWRHRDGHVETWLDDAGNPKHGPPGSPPPFPFPVNKSGTPYVPLPVEDDSAFIPC